jgi:hypothetical protein
MAEEAKFFQHFQIKAEILAKTIPGAVQTLSFAERGVPELVAATSRPWIVDQIIGQRHVSCSIESMVTEDMVLGEGLISDKTRYKNTIDAIPPATDPTNFYLSEFSASIKAGEPARITYSFLTPEMTSPEWWTEVSTPDPDEVCIGDKMAVVCGDNAVFHGMPKAQPDPSGILSMEASANLNLAPVQVSDSGSPAWFTITYPVDISLVVRSVRRMDWQTGSDVGEDHCFRVIGTYLLPGSQSISVGGMAEFIMSMGGVDIKIPDLLDT